MPRKYAVLRQFAQDFDRLLTEAETAFAHLRTGGAPTQAEILALYRPIHSLKGICGMLDETQLLVKAFHRLEDVLPPLLPVRVTGKKEARGDWSAIGEGTFRMAREVERILQGKLELWRKLGADENESRGLVAEFRHAGRSVQTWIPVTSLLGIVAAAEVETAGVDAANRAGDAAAAEEALLVDLTAGTVAVFFTQIHSTCTRLDAVQNGVAQSFKDWWGATRKSAGRSAA